MMRRVLVLLMLLPFAGCAVGPNYHKPAAVPAAMAPFGPAPATDPAGQLPARWWSLYADPQLDALVEEALAHNSDLRVAAANLDRARAVLRENRAARLPTTEVSGGATYERNANTGHDPKTVYNGALDLSYEVDLFGRVTRSIQAARADYEASAATRDAVRVTVAAATTQAYFDACLLGVRVDVANRSLGLVSQSYDLTRRQIQLGVGSDYELSRAGVIVEQQRAAAAALEGLRQQALADLAVLLGRPASEIPAAVAACRAAPKLIRPIPIGDGAALLARRPDIRAAERTLAADTARIGVATADLFPTITLGGNVAAAGTSLAGATSRSGVSFGIGPLISWTFPNIAAARARIQHAGADARASLARFDGTVLTALGEVQRALQAYQAELRRNQALDKAVANSRRAYDLAGVRLRYGSISQLEQISVERDLIDSEAARAESDATLGDDQVALFRALGGGWQDAPAIDPHPTAIVAGIPGD